MNTPVSLPAAALLALRRLATTIIALAVILAADLVLDGTPMTIFVVVVLGVLLATYVRRDAAREDPERPRDPFDALTDRARTVVQYGPMLIAIAVFVVADLEPVAFVLVAIALFLVTMTALLWWFNRAAGAPAT